MGSFSSLLGIIVILSLINAQSFQSPSSESTCDCQGIKITVGTQSYMKHEAQRGENYISIEEPFVRLSDFPQFSATLAEARITNWLFQSGVPLQDHEAMILAGTFNDLPNLTHLELYLSGEAGFLAIAEGLSNLRLLEYLSLRWDPLPLPSLQIIATTLRSWQSLALQEVKLRGNIVGSILDTLPRHITSLHIHYSNEDDMRHPDALPSNFPYLSALHISLPETTRDNHPKHNTDNAHIVDALGEALVTLQGLSDLTLSHVSLGEAGGRMLATLILPRLHRLRTLTLTSTSLGDKGIIALSSVIVPPRLTTLSLRHNNIGDSGAQALAHALRAPFNKVATLRLSHNSIGDSGARALAAVFTRGHSVTECHLDSNRIGDIGALALVAATQAMTKVYLAYNPIDSLTVFKQAQELGFVLHPKLHFF